MKSKLSAALMLLMLFISTVAIALPVVPVNATDGVLNVLFDQDVDWAHVKVEEFANSVKWTIDLDESSAYLNNPVAGIVVIIGIGNEIKFQVHNNDGVDPHYPHGTWLISYYESGWHTGSPDYKNYPLPDGITATGGRSKSENPQMVFTVTIGKAYLANEFKWAVYFKGGSGGRTFYPADFSWYDTNTSDMATAKYLILGGAVASIAKAKGTSEQYYWGSGCWAAVLGQKFEIYIDPTVPPFDVLGSFKIDDISSISYHTNKPGSQNDVDFYLVIYTKPDGVDDKASWYGYKLIGEPYFSRNLNAPSNQWNKWSTDVGTNQLTFFDLDTIGFYGFYGQPTLQDIQAGPINWHYYYSGCPVTNIDYGVEVVKYISFQTGTNWMNTFQGYIDAITIGLKDGTTVSIDLEGFVSEVWVDDDWTGLPPGYEVEPGKFIGYNAFAKIQDGINAVAPEGIVHVYPGTYMEQLIINKSLSLQGAVGAKIVAPNTRSTFTIPESSATWDPIIFAYGSLSGSDTISVTIDGFEIDGGNKASSSYRYVGILCRNVKPGTISNNVIHSLYPPSGKGSGPQTFGIMVYGDSEMTISHNEVRDFSRGGIGISGDAGQNPDPYALVQQNTVFGNGLETETNWWAENGIQVGYGATANVVGNHVYNCTVNNPSWSATGIMAVDTDGVTIESNYVEGCDLGIAAVDFPESKYGSLYHLILSNVDIIGNTLVGNTWQVDISNDARNITLICNNILNAIEDGIDVWSYSGVTVYPTNVKINYNNIVGSGTYGLWVEDDVLEQVDARYNWWGNASGPYHPTLNPGGTGDELYGNANFSPWLLAEKVPPLVHDVAVINVVASPSRVVVGTAVQVSVTVKNEGNTYETFDVSLYYDNHFISKQTITDMIPGSTKILVFTWDTTGVTPYGDYAIKAEADAVPGETDLADNIKTITVRIGEKPTLNVEPPTYNAKLLGETFTVNITINDLGAYWRLVGLEFRIAYNSTLLRVVNVTEGPFLKDPRWNHHGTFFIYFIERATVLPNGTIIPSHVLIGTLLLPNATGYWEEFPHGEGVVASITFEVIYQDRGYDKKLGYIIPPIASNFALFGSRVIDDDGLLIPHDAEGWQCTIYPTNIADVNYDGYVGIDDIFIISSAFGEEPGRPRWNPDLDLNKDNYIGIDDIYIAASNFGWEPDP